MQAIIKLPDSLVEDSCYLVRNIKATTKKSIDTLVEDLCDEFAFDDPDQFSVVAIVAGHNEVLLSGVDY